MNNIVACVDFSKSTSAVVEIATAFATALRSKLHLLNVAVLPSRVEMKRSLNSRGSPTRGIDQARRQLNELREPLREHSISVATILLEEHGDVAPAILEEIDRIGADLVVVGSHGQGAAHGMLVGSTAEGVLRKAKCPVVFAPRRVNGEPKKRKSSRGMATA